MITSATIENFKGIGDRDMAFRLPLKPVTLLFGPNSAGKSSVLQAIRYARGVMERHDLDGEGLAPGPNRGGPGVPDQREDGGCIRSCGPPTH